MILLRDAWKHLVRNQGYVCTYLLVCLGMGALYHGCVEFIHVHYPDAAALPGWVAPFRFVLRLLLIAGYAFVQSCIFSALGKDIDKPLWKCAGIRDAVQRFFPLWFLINLIMMSFLQFLVISPESMRVQVEFFRFLWFIFALPIGACIMYWGALDWKRLPEALAPLVKMLPMVLPVFILNIMLYLYQLTLMLELPESWFHSIPLLVLFDIPGVLGDCLIFVMMWRICMLHRDRAFTDEKGPFDF